MRLLTRSIRPPDDIVPNPNDPADVPPATVGPPAWNPGDPDGLEVVEPDPPFQPPPPVMRPMPWSGWPSDWWTPPWNARFTRLTDIAWACVDLNSRILATMPPYLVGNAPSLDTDWMRNPDPDLYTSWAEFCKQLFWDYQLGEVFVLATARYATGWPARFHVVPPWYVNVEIDNGLRSYEIGGADVSSDILHIRYTSVVGNAHGHGPLEAGAANLIASQMLNQYGAGLASAGGIPSSVLQHPDELSAEQAADLKAQWIAARQSNLGEPAVLSGGVTWAATQLNPKDMALIELQQYSESRIAVMLGVPPHLVGLPSGVDSMTYKNVDAIFDYHWRAGLRPSAEQVGAALSEWLLPRGTVIEFNKDAYVQAEPLLRAQTYQILNAIVDQSGNPAMTVDEIRRAERISEGTS